MKKRLFFIFIILFMFKSNISIAVASQLKEKNIESSNKLYLTNGIEKDKEGLLSEKEYTFDDKRIITGVADKNSKIYIKIYKTEDNSNNVVKVYDVFIVGKSEIFSFEIELIEGENLIYVEAVSEDEKLKSEVHFKIIRLKKEIKEKLENIILPEQRFNAGELIVAR